MATFEPIPARFVPSQQRGPDVAVYILPGDHELCYEWSFKRLLGDRQTRTYIRCGCRAAKVFEPQRYTEPIPSCRIEDGQFVTDPANRSRPHFCRPRSTPRAMMRRLVIGKCNELRELIAQAHLSYSTRTCPAS
ncbi:hypothetical protein Q1695_000768 [Nippostrongylus brasiliensis]|nr:hypothetical protein Q1695_000768 [Nippostrongylus brasiliensis]